MVPGEGRTGAVPGCAGRPGRAEQPRAHPSPTVPVPCGQRGRCCRHRGGKHQVSAVGQSPGSLSTQGFPWKPGREPGRAGCCQCHPTGSHPLKLRQVMLPHSPQSQQSPQVPWRWCRALTSSPKSITLHLRVVCAPYLLFLTPEPCQPSVWRWDVHFQSQHPQIQLPTCSPSLSGVTVSRVPQALVAQ